MKRFSIILGVGLFTSAALFASGSHGVEEGKMMNHSKSMTNKEMNKMNHMEDENHKGKMMNHSNTKGMPNKEMNHMGDEKHIMPHGNMMDHSNMNGMTKKQIQHCNDMMKNITSKNDSWTPPRNILAELYPEGLE